LIAFSLISVYQDSEIIQRIKMDALADVVSGVFGEDKLDEFKRSLAESQELSSLLASGLKSGNGRVAKLKAGSEESTKRSRAVVKPKADGVRCQALVWMLEKNAEGEWIPQRCTRGCEEGSDYCKGHGAVDGKKCADCSAYHGEDVIHGFKHEHLGTIHESSYVITKFWNELVRYTERQQKLKSGELIPSSSKKSEKVSLSSSAEKTVKARRVIDNPYMKWLASVRGEIKASLLAENPDMGKGREITTAVTKKAGEMWKALSKEEKDTWKSQKVDSDEDDLPPALIEDDGVAGSSDNEASMPETSDSVVHAASSLAEAEAEDDESIQLVFNEEHNVWVDEDTGLYYESNDAESAPLGQMSGGKPVAFKKVSKK
jgi:hypothetical protein